MASRSLCLSCLRRSLHQIEALAPLNGIHRVAFSTTTSLNKLAVAASSASRKGRTLRLARNKRPEVTRRPAVGERKMLRKQVVLSNGNAIEVDLQDITEERVHQDRLKEEHGRVLSFTDDTIDALRALKVFKPGQGWSLFRRPSSLIRKETVELASEFQKISDHGQAGTVRKVLFGERWSGKSVLQLQALAMASLKNWIIIHVPEALELVNGHTSYSPISAPEETIYMQPTYTAHLLSNILNANKAVLMRLRLKTQSRLPIPANASLAQLVQLGAEDPDIAWLVWRSLLSELLTPSRAEDGLQRPPVLFTLDGINHIMRLSAYVDAGLKPIHAHRLVLVRDFVNLLSGKTIMPNGGMVLGATSESNRAAARTLDDSLLHNLAVQNGREPPVVDPYIPQDERVQEVMKTVKVQKLEGLSKQEARGIIEYYAKSGMTRSKVTDLLVNETWTLAGNGIIGQIERGSVRSRF